MTNHPIPRPTLAAIEALLDEWANELNRLWPIQGGVATTGPDGKPRSLLASDIHNHWAGITPSREWYDDPAEKVIHAAVQGDTLWNATLVNRRTGEPRPPLEYIENALGRYASLTGFHAVPGGIAYSDDGQTSSTLLARTVYDRWADLTPDPKPDTPEDVNDLDAADIIRGAVHNAGVECFWA